jgi:hypothetical protein
MCIHDVSPRTMDRPILRPGLNIRAADQPAPVSPAPRSLLSVISRPRSALRPLWMPFLFCHRMLDLPSPLKSLLAIVCQPAAALLSVCSSCIAEAIRALFSAAAANAKFAWPSRPLSLMRDGDPAATANDHGAAISMATLATSLRAHIVTSLVDSFRSIRRCRAPGRRSPSLWRHRVFGRIWPGLLQVRFEHKLCHG